MMFRVVSLAFTLALLLTGGVAAQEGPLVLDVADATVNQDTQKPRLVVLAILSAASTKAFADYTHAHRDQVSEILVDQSVVWSPRIMEAISSGQVPIMTFELTQLKDARALANRLKTHQAQLSVRPKPVPAE